MTDNGDRPLPARLDPRAGAPSRRERRADARAGRGGAGRRRAVVAGRVATAVVSAALLAGSGWGWYLGQVADASMNRTDAIPDTGNEGNGDAMNLLLVGSDSRASASEEELAQLNTEANDGVNTDTMILVHVPADGSKASFVSFPRDSFVEIPGYGKHKLNSAYAYGYYQEAGDDASDAERQAAGAQLLIQTISGVTGLSIDHYAEVDLLGFFKLSEVVGGVEVNLCAPVKEANSGVDLPAGVQTIQGEQALSFVRQRYDLPRGDLDRIVRQQTFMAGMIRKMLSDNVLLDLGKQRRLVEAAADSLTVDEDLKLLDLAAQMQSVTPDSIQFQTVPNVGTDRDPEAGSIVRLADQKALRAFFADLSAEPEPAPGTTPPPPADAPDPVPASEVSVAVYNGSGTSGLAASTKTELEEQGFPVTTTGNADSRDYEATEIRYAAGDEQLAATLAAAVPGAVLVASDEPSRGTVHLVLGSDFNGVGVPVTAPEPTEAAAPEDQRTAADTGCIN
ncbi:LCP family protein [Blastococcus sp. TML/M2B]|uniref:LCP family protein n=1 Tax=unclassified Blastococcus TaxID=2619396 RepID=UPI00190E072A|nr:MULTISPECIES: LCP family protein [unclassified Blastococcus]MBN1093825.1 LCP family protein [Blastococcus sp. TML/M2B]MBN1096051.1 LCP family protein [Blastococcus sp. TML/C7B]